MATRNNSRFSSENSIASSSHHQPPNPIKAAKPRGRPPGSKNKPKPIQVKPKLAEPSTKIIKVNVTPGKDVIETIINVAHQSHVSLTILNASGKIDNATLRTSPHTGALKLYGPFTLVSLTGSYIYKNHYTLHHGATPPPPQSFGINLCTSQGQVFGGPVAGTVIAGDNVNLMISTFTNPDIYEHIPAGKHEDNKDNNQP